MAGCDLPQPGHLVPKKPVTLILRGILAGAIFFIASSPAMAQGTTTDDRIKALEEQLKAVLQVVENLSTEIQSLKESEGALTAADAIDESALARRLDEVDTAIAETNARLESVEDLAFEVDEKLGSRATVKAFDAKSLDIGGFMHTALTLVDGKDNTEAGFNRLTFELLAKARLADDWSLFVAQAFIRESDINYIDPAGRLDPNFTVVSKTPLVIATATYEPSDKLTLDVGRFITPHGIVNIEHFPAILLDPEQPQFLRPFGGQTIFANFMNGVRATGQFYRPFGGDGMLGYAAYAGSFVDNADSFNYGGRLFWRFGDSGLTAGANLGGGRRTDANSDYLLYGADILYDKGPVIWKNEIFITDEDLGGDRLAFYTQPGWRFADRWTAFYRFDFLDNGLREGDRIEHAFGLTFKPIATAHLRAIARFNHFDDAPGFPDANAENYQLSATFSF